MRAYLARVPAGEDSDGMTTVQRVEVGIRGHDPAEVARALGASTRGEFMTNDNLNVFTPRGYWEGWIALARGDAAGARAAFTAARPALEARANATPDLAGPWIHLSLLDALLGRKAEALAEGRRALAISPPEQDGFNGPVVALTWAAVLAQVGECDAALAQLQARSARPSGPTYGDLKLNPRWDPLRGDSRFQQLVTDLAPKDLPR